MKIILSFVFGLCIIIQMTLGHALALSKEELQKKLDAFVSAQHAPGIALALSLPKQQKHNEPLLLASGLASLELNVPMQNDMIFSFGSLSKMVTAMRIKELIFNEKLSLKTDIRSLVPELAQFKHTINIEQVLKHSGGFPDFFEIPALLENLAKPWTSKEILELLGQTQLKFIPGSEQKYNNTGYYLLGYLLLQQNLDLQNFMVKAFKQTLDISTVSDSEVIPKKARGYSVNYDKKTVLPPFIGSNLALGSGDVQGTVKDMLILLSSWKNYKLVPEYFLAEHGKKLHEKKTVQKFFNSQWGFFEGIELFLMDNGKAYLGKGGMYPGYAAYYFYDPKNEVQLVIACNQDGASHALWDLALEILQTSSGAEN